ncbi:hypothetical protein [Bradyrhizobium canariense]|uniref:Cysteine rich repeat-containing protein n=1 Tax=Bradyrhizobium canariense TaxID=255045 RepID=A0A1H2AEA8_9BRAD|nr:hypothetical protein [Bradyrhizobium canariense]SDT44207.1 hypothetical protein SAMN05444158_6089 [Bradyrhizobium canariense]
MLVARSRNFQLGLLFVTALSLTALWPAVSEAYTPEQQQACSGDAFRLCSSEIPDVDRVTVCMIRNKEQLSPGCQAFFRSGPEPDVVQGDTGAPLNLKPATVRKHTRPHQLKKPVKRDAT